MRKAIIYLTAMSVTCVIATTGCTTTRPFPLGATVAVSIPAERWPGTRVKMVTHDLKSDREPFVQLYRTVTRVGRCNPSKFTDEGAVDVIHVSVNSGKADESASFTIFKDKTGRWLSGGYGAAETVDSDADFTEYRYDPSAIASVKTWYEKNVPPADRSR